MRRIPENLRHRKEISRCRSCDELIWWGYRFQKPFPFNVGFEKDGSPYRSSSHRETCPFATDYEPKNHSNLRDRADAYTAAVNQWKATCLQDGEPLPINWMALRRHNVPEKLAMRISWKLTERGAPLDNWHPADIIPHLHAIAVTEKRVVAVLVKPAFFNLIHHYLHGFTMSVFGEMPERKDVTIAGYRLVPICALPKLPYNQVRDFSLAEKYTR